MHRPRSADEIVRTCRAAYQLRLGLSGAHGAGHACSESPRMLDRASTACARWLQVPVVERVMAIPTRHVLTLLAPVALGGIVALRTTCLGPLVAVPAIVVGVIAATSPALYIASAAAGFAPPLGTMIRALGIAL